MIVELFKRKERPNWKRQKCGDDEGEPKRIGQIFYYAWRSKRENRNHTSNINTEDYMFRTESVYLQIVNILELKLLGTE